MDVEVYDPLLTQYRQLTGIKLAFAYVTASSYFTEDCDFFKVEEEILRAHSVTPSRGSL